MASETLTVAYPSTRKVAWDFVLSEWVVTLFLMIGVMVSLFTQIFAWGVIPEMVSYLVPDQRVHLSFAVNMFESGKPPIAHFLYQASVIGLHSFTPSWLLNGVLANLLPQIVTAILIYLALRACVVPYEAAWRPVQKWIARLGCAALALGLLIAEPLFLLLNPFNGQPNQILLGFIPPTTYHNPTITILRPFSVALYFLITAYMLPAAKLRLKYITIAAVIVLMIAVTVLSGLSKPNYLLALLPALCLVLAWSFWKKRIVDWRFALIGVLLPTLGMLAWQYIFTYVNPTEQLNTGGGLIISPFTVVLQISGPSITVMALRFVVSILFPSVIYLLWWKQAIHNRALNFAWITFAFGAFLMYFLSETGVREYDGNFLWSAYITVFVLYIASIRFALQMGLKSQQFYNWRTLFIVGLFITHVLSGISYIDWVNQWLFSTL